MRATRKRKQKGPGSGRAVAPDKEKDMRRKKHQTETAPVVVEEQVATVEPDSEASDGLDQETIDRISKMELEELAPEIGKKRQEISMLEAELAAKRAYAQQLFSRNQEILQDLRISVGAVVVEKPHTDGRASSSPTKNLKISAVRTIDWARKAGDTIERAIEKAMARTLESAQGRYGMNKLPHELIDYIKNEAPRIFESKTEPPTPAAA